MVERFRELCKEAVEADPLKPVAVVYEEELSKLKRMMDLQETDLAEFEGLCPNFHALAPSLYRWTYDSDSDYD